MLGDHIHDATCGGQGACSGTFGYSSDPYAMMNAAAFRPGELDKLRKLDDQLADCRARRKAAILRVSRMLREWGADL